MRLLPSVLPLVVLVACAPAVDRTEVLRVPSPDGALDAVVTQTSAGATTPFGYLLTLPVAGCPASDDPVLRVVGASRSASAAGVSVEWVAPRTVRVTWLDARFRDPDADSLAVATAVAPVTLVSGGGVDDPAAPPGGMPPVPRPARAC